jgi:hypothetical protein
MVNNTETCLCGKDYSGDFCEFLVNGLTQLTVCQNKKCKVYYPNDKGNTCLVYNNEETCFCSDGYYGNSCEYDYYNQDTTSITNCEKTNCLNGYFLYIFFFHFYFD